MREVAILLMFLTFKLLALLELGKQDKILFSSLARGSKPPLKSVFLFYAIMPELLERRSLTSSTNRGNEWRP